MKSLYLKDNSRLAVKTGTDVENSGFIAVYEDFNEEQRLYTIFKTASAGVQCLLPAGKHVIHWHEIGEINEISENFDQYFNNLNQ